MGPTVYYPAYSQVGDILVIAISVIFILLLAESFIDKSRSFKIFSAMIIMIVAAAVVNLIYNSLLRTDIVSRGFLLGARVFYRYLLYGILTGFIYYAVEAMSLETPERQKYLTIANIMLSASIVLETAMGVLSGKLRLNRALGTAFVVCYATYIVFISCLLIKYRYRLVRQIFNGMFSTIICSIAIFITQWIFHNTSYTTATFLFPILAILYLMHSNPYDQTTGAVNERSFDSLIRESYERHDGLVIMSLRLFGFEQDGSFTNEMKTDVLSFGNKIAKGAVMFKVSGGRLLFVFRKI